MSNSHRTMDAKKAARKANAMKMNVTKVKPVVVKHVLDEQVMSIYDIKVSTLNQGSTLKFTFAGEVCKRAVGRLKLLE